MISVPRTPPHRWHGESANCYANRLAFAEEQAVGFWCIGYGLDEDTVRAPFRAKAEAEGITAP